MIGTIYSAYFVSSGITICAKKKAVNKENAIDYIFEIEEEDIVEFHEEKVSESTYAYHLTLSASSRDAQYYFSKEPYGKAYREIVEYNKTKHRKEFASK